MGEINIPLALALAAVSFVFYTKVIKRSGRYAALPPGPKPHSLDVTGFFGNTIPRPYPWKAFESWSREYGPDVCTIWTGSKPTILIGTYKAANEIMEKMSGITSDRPRSVVAGETMSGGMRILLIGYTERWRKLRKVLHSALQPKKAESYQPVQSKATHTLLNDLLTDPDNHTQHTRTYAAAVIMTVTYGKTTPTRYHDSDVQLVNEYAKVLGKWAAPSSHPANAWPALRLIPGVMKKFQQMHLKELNLFDSQLQKVRSSVAGQKGDVEPCFGTWLIEHQKEFGLSNHEAAYIGGSMYGAGAETSASAISIGLMASACFEEAQHKAQEELDRVIGRERPPTWEDMDDLPYIQAFVKENFRWHPVSTGGFAHATTEDFTYQGYVIPKGCTILGNHWAIHRDPAVFPEPDKFRPERWLNTAPDGSISVKPDRELRHFTYGFGRRVCPGQNVANRSLYITLSNILWAFKIAKKTDSNGKALPIDTDAFTDTANSFPLPFNLDIRPRFEGAADMIKRMAIVEDA